MIIDFHSHAPQSLIQTVDPAQYDALTNGHDARLNVGVHPWTTANRDLTEMQLRRLADILASGDKRVVAVGEIGLDRCRGGADEYQIEVVRRQIELAERYRLPVVLHIVRSYDILLNLLKQMRPETAIAIHGIQANPDIIRQLSRYNIYMSAGARTSDATIAAIDPAHLLVETDADAYIPPDTDPATSSALETLVTRIAHVKGDTPEHIIQLTNRNAGRFYNPDYDNPTNRLNL